jgi:AcrR family transcriptional regulator
MPAIRASNIQAHRAVVRRDILRAFGALLEEKSFAAITIGDIASQTGLGRGSLYRYFADKEAVLLGYLQTVAAEIVGLIQEECWSTAPDAFARAVRVALAANLNRSTQAAYANVAALSDLNRNRAERTIKQIEDALRTVIETTETAAAARWHPDDAAAIAACISGFGPLVRVEADVERLAVLITRRPPPNSP